MNSKLLFPSLALLCALASAACGSSVFEGSGGGAGGGSAGSGGGSGGGEAGAGGGAAGAGGGAAGAGGGAAGAGGGAAGAGGGAGGGAAGGSGGGAAGAGGGAAGAGGGAAGGSGGGSAEPTIFLSGGVTATLTGFTPIATSQPTALGTMTSISIEGSLPYQDQTLSCIFGLSFSAPLADLTYDSTDSSYLDTVELIGNGGSATTWSARNDGPFSQGAMSVTISSFNFLSTTEFSTSFLVHGTINASLPGPSASTDGGSAADVAVTGSF